jgi:hypothetical protein
MHALGEIQTHDSSFERAKVVLALDLAVTKKIKVRIYKSIILPVILYGCETWSLTLMEEHGYYTSYEILLPLDSVLQLSFTSNYTNIPLLSTTAINPIRIYTTVLTGNNKTGKLLYVPEYTVSMTVLCNSCADYYITCYVL